MEAIFSGPIREQGGMLEEGISIFTVHLKVQKVQWDIKVVHICRSTKEGQS